MEQYGNFFNAPRVQIQCNISRASYVPFFHSIKSTRYIRKNFHISMHNFSTSSSFAQLTSMHFCRKFQIILFRHAYIKSIQVVQVFFFTHELQLWDLIAKSTYCAVQFAFPYSDISITVIYNIPGFIKLALLNCTFGMLNKFWCFSLSHAVCGGTLSITRTADTMSFSIRYCTRCLPMKPQPAKRKTQI